MESEIWISAAYNCLSAGLKGQHLMLKIGLQAGLLHIQSKTGLTSTALTGCRLMLLELVLGLLYCGVVKCIIEVLCSLVVI